MRRSPIHWRRRAAIAALGAAVFCSVMMIAHAGVTHYGVQSTAAQAKERLKLVGATIGTRIERFRYLPEVIARSREIEELFRNPQSISAVQTANALLARINIASGAMELFVTDRLGQTITASNHGQPGSFIGHNYRFRPYLVDAIATGFGRYYAVGVTTGEPGYFLAVPIRLDGRIVGVAIVKIDLLPLERQWRDAGEFVAVKDREGVIFLSSQQNWRYRAMQPIDDEKRLLIRREQRYGPDDIVLLPQEMTTIGWSNVPVISMDERFGGKQRLLAELPYGESGWTVVYLADLSWVFSQANIAALAAGLALLTFAGLKIAQQRRLARSLRLRVMSELESRVAERTRALSETNDSLEKEIAERQQAQAQLDRTRNSLTQAEKLAAIGQAFAGLAHEINQPLAALTTYLASTKLLAARNDFAAVQSNVDVMGDVVGRVSHLTDQLKRLARRDDEAMGEADVASSIHRVVNLLKFRLSDLGIKLNCRADEALPVLGSMAQIDQIVLNLLSNAIDAVQGSDDPHIRIEGFRDDLSCVVRLHDNGPGIAPEARQRLFEPFHTTKAAGEGLGLGLATVHRMIEKHHGSIKAGTSDLGGAEFTLRFPLLVSFASVAK